MAQAVEHLICENLLCKCEALSSNPGPTKEFSKKRSLCELGKPTKDGRRQGWLAALTPAGTKGYHEGALTGEEASL
jgi:hypothetical protein